MKLYIIQSMGNAQMYYCPKQESWNLTIFHVKKLLGEKEAIALIDEKLPKGDYQLHTVIRKF